MTKAEAYVSRSRLWRQEIQRTEDHGSMADTHVNIYFRYSMLDDDGKTIGDATHRLSCYSSHGDSILWERAPISDPRYEWQVVRGWWMGFNITDGNIEFVYDHALPDLI